MLENMKAAIATSSDVVFKKYDSGKLRYDLLPNEIVEAVVQVMMYGAFTKGYGVGNWMKASTKEDLLRYYNAERRHLEAYRKGEYNDPESGLPHLAHAICNLMFLHYLEEKQHDKSNNS